LEKTNVRLRGALLWQKGSTHELVLQQYWPGQAADELLHPPLAGL
jgi:hypothetical protein